MAALALLAWLGQPPPPATVRLAGDFDPEVAEEMGWGPLLENEDACPLSLSVDGVHALDEREALLYGSLDAAPGAYRSLLLRTDDGGASWSEVMAPMPGSAVLDVSFASPARGVALVGWTVEGPGTLWAYGTEDGGRSWRRLAEIAKPHNLDQPVRLQCRDHRRCRVQLECSDQSEGPGHLLETADGGHTWRPGKPAALPPLSDIAIATDGTAWQIAAAPDEGDVIQLLRRRRGEAAWTPLPSLPGGFWLTSRGELSACGAREQSRLTMGCE